MCQLFSAIAETYLTPGLMAGLLEAPDEFHGGVPIVPREAESGDYAGLFDYDNITFTTSLDLQFPPTPPAFAQFGIARIPPPAPPPFESAQSMETLAYMSIFIFSLMTITCVLF